MRPEQDDPASRVERAFAAIAATRMAGLPLCNPALAVEACGFRPWNGLWLGVLVTPRAINLMLLPDGNPAFRRLGADQRQTWTFPSGDYAFHGAASPMASASARAAAIDCDTEQMPHTRGANMSASMGCLPRRICSKPR